MKKEVGSMKYFPDNLREEYEYMIIHINQLAQSGLLDTCCGIIDMNKAKKG